jgi:hypothetical protein
MTTSNLIWGLCALTVAVLALVRPPESVFPRFLRGYVLSVLGALTIFYAVDWLVVRLGAGYALAEDTVLFAVIGGLLLLVALRAFPFYWEILRVWPIFSSLSDRGRQVLIGGFGLLCIYFAWRSTRDLHAAQLQCRDLYAVAHSPRDSLLVSQQVPDNSFRPGRRRYAPIPPPYTCGSLPSR